MSGNWNHLPLRRTVAARLQRRQVVDDRRRFQPPAPRHTLLILWHPQTLCVREMNSQRGRVSGDISIWTGIAPTYHVCAKRHYVECKYDNKEQNTAIAQRIDSQSKEYCEYTGISVPNVNIWTKVLSNSRAVERYCARNSTSPTYVMHTQLSKFKLKKQATVQHKR
jgi:hypothetical protein